MRAVNFILNATLSAVFIMVIFAFGPIVESKLFPVYSKFRLIYAKEVPGGTSATFEFTKFRNCDPQGYAFFNSELGQPFHQIVTKVQPSLEGRSRARIRPLGTQQTYPYLFPDVTPIELRETVFAEIYSRCHPLWITVSKVYP